MPPVEGPPEARLGCRSEARAPRGGMHLFFVGGSLAEEAALTKIPIKSASYEDAKDTLTLQNSS